MALFPGRWSVHLRKLAELARKCQHSPMVSDSVPAQVLALASLDYPDWMWKVNKTNPFIS